LARGGVVAMIWPIWQSNVGWRVLSPGEIINPGEWRVVDLQQRNYQLQPSLFSGRGSFWYARPDQLVGREVWILQKNN
ncbi:MAG: hypothetical protein NTV81_00310, partial [Candidatus Komeilibacteria bacterium]|nr:hypothetical protein [Candidatus Komeilibacteria bacterium]